MEETETKLPLDTPLLLVKPPLGCSTPQIFRVLKLDKCSTQDPRTLLSQFSDDLSQLPALCVNDLEEPAFGW